jgi:hypothetical protein
VQAGVDEAIWRAEELLTRMRAGLVEASSDLVPWLGEPDEHEVRQAVQRIEEPLRRLVDELFWFDLASDPHGELLRKALTGMSAVDLEAYLATAVEIPAPPPQAASNGDGNGDGADAAGIAASGPGEGATTATAAALNQANLRLMLAGLALVDALPAEVNLPGAARTDAAVTAVALPWKRRDGSVTVEDVHALDLTAGRLAHRLDRCRALWSDALARWVRVLSHPAVAALVGARANRLEDDSVNEEDAEAVLAGDESRLTDLVAGEIKAQHLANRPERVQLLVEAAAASGLDPRRWIFALRTLRPLFRSEAAELEPLLGDPESPRLDDIRLYLDRVEALSQRWAAIDSQGFLGLAEVADEAVVHAVNRLTAHENYGIIRRLKELLQKCTVLASADSLRHRIAAAVARLEGLAKYACHFCRRNEMDLESSVVLEAKKETHRTYGFNSTTIHYLTTKDIVYRCRRCAELHDYLDSVATWTRGCLGIVLALLWLRILTQSPDAIFGVVVFGTLAAAVILWVVGEVARFMAKQIVTPWGDRHYGDIRGAAQYQRLRSEGFGITAQFGKNSFNTLLNKQQGK